MSNTNEQEMNKAFKKFELLLSSNKARDYIRKAEEALAFDIEIYLHPIRQDLAECMEIIADLIRERGTTSPLIQTAIPVIEKYLDPGHHFAKEIARLEKEITEKKRKHPDFIYAAKLNMLVQKYDSMLKYDKLDSIEYGRILDQLEAAKRTLSDHIQKKVRLAQRALAPDMLELAQFQLELAHHQEKVLSIKEKLLTEVQNHSRNTLKNLVHIFEEADPDLADTIIAQTQSLVSMGDVTSLPNQKKIPTNLKEFKEELNNQQERLKQLEKRQHLCREQLQKLITFEEAIFNTYGDQLRSKGIQFKKPIIVEKTGIGARNPTLKKSSRMVHRKP